MALQVWLVAFRDGCLPMEILKGNKEMVRGGELYLTDLTMFQYHDVYWHENCVQNGDLAVPLHGAPELPHTYPASLIDAF
jgi:hypothetical protein